MHLVLVRHGEPAWIENGQNRDNPRLTERGRFQSTLTAVALAERHFDHVWVSTKTRAIETAAPYEHLTGVTGERYRYLEEIHNPEWEGTDTDAMKVFAEHRRRHPEHQWDGIDGGESVTDFRERVCIGLDTALAGLGVTRSDHELPVWNLTEEALDTSVLLFAHAGTNSVILTHLLGVNPVPWEWERFVTQHASISEIHAIEIGNGHAFSMIGLSRTRHLPDHLLTR